MKPLWSSTFSQIPGMPSRVAAEQVTTCTVHPPGGAQTGAARFHTRGEPARRGRGSAPSALLMAMRSVISMMPRFMPCNSSPAPGASAAERNPPSPERPSPTALRPPSRRSSSRSRRLRTAASFPASAAQRRRARPEGDGRMKARSYCASVSMRVLSPRMLPPEIWLLGIDRQNRHLLAAIPRQVRAERFDACCSCPRPGSGNAEPNRVSRTRQAIFNNVLRQFGVPRPRAFNQCDRLAEHRTVAAQHALDVLIARQPPASPPRCLLDQVARRFRRWNSRLNG